MASGGVTEEQRIKDALEMATAKNPEMMADVVQYIVVQCNDSSLRGRIDFYQYSLLLEKSILGLWSVVYLGHYPKDDKELATCDEVFDSGANFISLLYTRVFNGMDYELLLTELRSRQQILMTSGGGTVQSR